MASMGSFPAGVDSSVILHSSNHHSPMVPLLAYRPRKRVEVGAFADCNSAGFSRNLTVDSFSRLSRCNGRRRWTTQHVKATTEGSGGGETDDESEDALQATIEKSKKVLEMQRDLFQQIAERKKLVSSIKNSIIDPKGSEQPYIENNVTISSVDATATEDATELGNDFPGNGTLFDANPQQQSKASTSRDVQSKKVSSVPLKSSVTPSSQPFSNNDLYKESKNTTEAIISGSKTSVGEDSNKKLKDTTVVAPRYSDYAEAQDSGVRRRYKVDGQVPWYVPCGGICYGDGNLVFIANDWHTALLPVYLKAYYRDNGLMQYTRSVLVIHNIAHQGRGPLDDFWYVNLPPHYLDLFKLYDPMGGDHFNIFAAGLKTADRVVTVSHGYAWELKTSEGGWGLHGIINENDWKLRGIVNGIDTKEWSPEVDVHLQSDGYVNYSLETLKPGKSQCKAALQKELGLPVREDVPLIGFIGRLDHQKGVDLIAEAVPWMMDQDVQLVMLGTGRPDLEELLRRFEGQYNDRARGWVGFSVKTAHRITAGADILLMPSRFEPCGLNQLYAMRYGTIPVVHAVGGLRDTVQPFNPFEESGLGWTFGRAETNELINALGNCLLTYREYKTSWDGLQRRCMMQDLSWDNAAQNYEEVLVAAKYQW
ncbi:hypothetical protein DH2020_036964 [Rehmannia glutinosa]|uniref:Starch synthase catalytic domain-containing protein n=1 Tax=Rehmannia glutinosa TaxID=99300 RepID=A0ABR0V483_REHGL